jgi:hypothetical protein
MVELMKQPRLRQNEPFLQLGHTREGKPFVLTGTDFERHKVISGITGSGKSYFLASLLLFLFSQGVTVLLIDPNGDLAKLIITLLAGSDYFTDPRAYQRLWYVDFKRAEQDAAIAFNVLKQDYNPYTIANNLLESMHRAFPTSTTTANLDNVILAACLVLIENGHRPLTDLNRLLLDKNFRETLLRNVTDPLVVEFFRSKFGEKVNSNLIDSTMRRSFLLTFSPSLRNTFGQRENKLNFRHLLDTGISCVFNLGGLDDQSKRLLGGALLVNIEQAFLSRADILPELRKPAHVFVDEFPVFMSHSEQSFTTILEQVRKYKGTLYLAHQTQSQLSSGMAGSLQNALSIVMKAGYADSSTLVQQFYRPRQEATGGFFDPLLHMLGLKDKPEKSVFDEMEKRDQARSLFETLNRQEALVTLNGSTTLIKTNTIPPVSVSPNKLKEIEDTYARRLLTPLSHIGQDFSVPGVVSPAPSTIVARRVTASSASNVQPLQTFVGAPGTDDQLQALFSVYGGYLTVAEVAKILQKSENTARNKLKRLVDAGILETQSVPRTSPSGKTPLVYSLKKGTRKHEFLEHALVSADILIQTALLPTVAHDFTIVALQSDATLKTSPIQLADGNTLVPDGKVLLTSQTYEYAVYYEVDRNTESREIILAKLNNYVTLARQCNCLTVAFCVTEGGDLRVKTLKNWAAEVVPNDYKELFLFAAVDLNSLSPERFFFSPSWSQLSAAKPVALLER